MFLDKIDTKGSTAFMELLQTHQIGTLHKALLDKTEPDFKKIDFLMSIYN
jgi:hypothetical protein